MPVYEVTTFDVCASGFERLRSYEEFVLLASIDAETDSDDLLDQWLRDIESCMRDDNFDYAAAKQAVQSYYDSTVRPLFYRRSNPFNLEPGREDIGITEEEGYTAYLYVRVEGAHFPVY